MSVATEFVPQTLQLTERAVAKLQQLVTEEGSEQLLFRVYVTGGGCSGFQYGFRFDEEAADDDIRIGRAGVTVLVDPLSYQYLVGGEVDYQEGLEGARFLVINPNAATTCGCGSSFSL